MIIDLKKVVLYLLIVFMISFLFLSHKQILKFIYPIHYKEVIFSEAKKYGLDPYLIISIIYVESKFDSEAISSRGARGLMQIMPDTGNWIAEILGYDNFSIDDLYIPEINIKCGSWYVDKLKQRFNNNLAIVLAAYNGGEGNVDSWLKEGSWDGKHENINQIPFLETRGYVNKVMKVYSRYNYIYK